MDQDWAAPCLFAGLDPALFIQTKHRKKEHIANENKT
jgi:hypothetical protein